MNDDDKMIILMFFVITWAAIVGLGVVTMTLGINHIIAEIDALSSRPPDCGSR